MAKLDHHPDRGNVGGGGVREHPVNLQPVSDLPRSAATRRVARAAFLDCVQLADGTWRVWGGAHEHLVDATVTSCDCPDHQIRGESCKHMERVRLALGDRNAIAALAALVPMPQRARRRKIAGRRADNVTSQQAGSAGGQATTTGGAGATDTPPAPACAPATDDLVDAMSTAELLDVLGPSWTGMTDAERRAYGPPAHEAAP